MSADRSFYRPLNVAQFAEYAAQVSQDFRVAVEVRDPQWLTPQFVAARRDAGATYCMGLLAKMPPIIEQLPILRAL